MRIVNCQNFILARNQVGNGLGQRKYIGLSGIDTKAGPGHAAFSFDVGFRIWRVGIDIQRPELGL